jgi:hypothetical protein
MKIGLTQDDRAGAFQPADDFRVLRRNPFLKQLARCRCSNARGVYEVLQGDGDSVQAASPMPPPTLRVHLTSGSQSLLASDGDECIQGGVVLFDSVQVRLRELHGGRGVSSQQLRRLARRQTRQILQ